MAGLIVFLWMLGAGAAFAAEEEEHNIPGLRHPALLRQVLGSVASKIAMLVLLADKTRGHMGSCRLTSITNYFMRRVQDKRCKGEY